MEYSVYHDESKEDAFWHVFLFVPNESKSIVLKELRAAKEVTCLNLTDFSFKNIGSNNSIECTRIWLSILCAALQQDDKNEMEPYYLGKDSIHCPVHRRKKPNHNNFTTSPKLKIAVFQQKNNHEDMEGFDNLINIETTFRMGLQGACSYLFNQENPLEIAQIILDREDHYQIAHGRDFDKNTVLSRLNRNFRTYCSLKNECTISGNSINDDDQVFLDLADLFLGTFRLGILKPQEKFCSDKEKKKHPLCYNLKTLMQRLNKGGARMNNSRFNRFGTFSSAEIINGEWNFTDLSTDFLKFPSVENLNLFD